MSNVTKFSALEVGGVPISGFALPVPGRVFFVSSTTGSNGNPGTKEKPFATVVYAMTRCTADAGDIIVGLPGHVETIIAAAQLVVKAGVRIIGLGTGSKRMTFDFTTAVGADIDFTGAGAVVENALFLGNVDALTGPLHLAAADLTFRNIETRDVTGQATDFIVTTAACDRLLIDGWTHRGAAAAGADTAITIVGGDGITIRNFWIDGNFAVAAIENVTTAATNLSIYGERPSYIRTRNAADVAVTLVATATGNVGPNIFVRIADDAANITEALVGADMQFFDPIMVCNADSERGLQYNATASADS